MADKQKILLVEDEPDLAHMFSLALTKSGFEVILRSTGLAALESMRHDRPALVLLDLVLPEMSGFEVLTEIKSDPQIKDIPVYAWSNLTQDEEIKQARDGGVLDFWVKSEYTPSTLAAKVKQVLQK